MEAASKRLEHLLHEIQNNLQVIRMEAKLVKTAKSNQIPQCVLDTIQGIEKLLEEVRQHFLLPTINIAAVKAIMSGTTRRFPSVAMQQSLNPSLFHLASQPLHLPRRDSQKFCPASELFPAFDCQPHHMQPMDLFSDSPLTPTRSSNLLLRFWGEDPS